jgi:GPH family glycoside/pentoside/hexuronide:cation symporter
MGKAAYLIVVGIPFFTCFSIWAMPYYGLQLELTPNYDERTRLTSWMTLFSKISSLSGAWVLAIVTGSWFLNPLTGKGDILIGMKTVCWFIAAGIIICGLLPAIFVKERYYEAEANHQPRDPFWRSIQESARCAPLWALIGITFFMVLGSAAVGNLSQYVNIYYLFDGNISGASIVAGWKGTALVITGILLIPFWAWLGERYDKRRVLISMILFTMVGHLLYYFCLRPSMPYLTLIPALFESGAVSAIWLFIPSMKADTADYDELKTTRRREGSINSFFSWFSKLSMTCAIGLGGFVLELSGFTAKNLHQTPAVLQKMIWILIFLPIGIWCIALAIAYFYPLSRCRMTEIRGELESRRGKL